ncbi:MAG TPA: helix-turn-helix domain-containing protein [Streptosporangiaceae bacterium]
MPSAPELGRGVLHQRAAASRFRLRRYPPSPGLAPFVDFYWVVRWDLRGQAAYEQAILPHPNVHLAFEPGRTAIYGVPTRLFLRKIEGLGATLGVRFRPGGFRPFWTGSIARLTDQVVPADRLLGPAGEQARQVIISDPDDAVLVGRAQTLLDSVRPARDPVAEEVAAMVARIVAEPALRQVGQLAADLDTPVRRLQRLFADYVGVSPKWVIRRARLHDAALRAEQAGPVDWAVLAADLGYSDQAHLTRDFTAIIGESPARYAAR